MCDQGSLVGLCVQDYKSLCTAVIYDLCHPDCTNRPIWFVHFDPLRPWKVGQTPHYSAFMSDAPTMQIWWPQIRRFQRYCTQVGYFCGRLKTDESRSGWPTFCVQSRFASGSLHARLQVWLCVQRLRFVSPYLSQNLICPFRPLWPRKVGQAPGICCTHVKYIHDPNLVTAGQQVTRIMQT